MSFNPLPSSPLPTVFLSFRHSPNRQNCGQPVPGMSAPQNFLSGAASDLSSVKRTTWVQPTVAWSEGVDSTNVRFRKAQEAPGQTNRYCGPEIDSLNNPAFVDAISGIPYHPAYPGAGTVAIGNAENSMLADCSTNHLLLWPEHSPPSLDSRFSPTLPTSCGDRQHTLADAYSYSKSHDREGFPVASGRNRYGPVTQSFAVMNTVLSPSSDLTSNNPRQVGSSALTEASTARRGTRSPRFFCRVPGCNSRGFTARHNYEYHVRAHSGKKPFKCRVCERNFGSQSDLRRHESKKRSCQRPWAASPRNASSRALNDLGTASHLLPGGRGQMDTLRLYSDYRLIDMV
ncbi:hypothetical protein PM082_004953 [Marasmius tenuissimus]|nr:hypothetical protein PM082_004953 [Marasmius tenuissimus]